MLSWGVVAGLRGGGGARRVLLASMLAATIVMVLASAGVYVYEPVYFDVRPTPPPVWYLPPLSDANASIAPNGTEANVTAWLSWTNVKLIDNPGFDNSADPWYCGLRRIALNCVYLATDPTTGDTGIVAIYGSFTGGFIIWGEAWLLQNFTVPTTVPTVDYAVRYRLADAVNIVYLEMYVEVYNATSGALIAQAVTYPTVSNTYTWFNGTLTVNLVPGYDYQYRVGIYYVALFFSGAVDFRVDYADLTTDTVTQPAFEGELVRINVTQNVTGRLVIENYTVSGVEGMVYIEGSDGSIGAILLNGTGINATTTRWVPLNVSNNPLYVPGKIQASVTGNTGSWAQLLGYLEWRVGGVTVRYPLNITITS